MKLIVCSEEFLCQTGKEICNDTLLHDLVLRELSRWYNLLLLLMMISVVVLGTSSTARSILGRWFGIIILTCLLRLTLMAALLRIVLWPINCFLAFFLLVSLQSCLVTRLFSLLPNSFNLFVDLLDLLSHLVFQLLPFPRDFDKVLRASACRYWNARCRCLIRKRAHCSLWLTICIVTDTREEFVSVHKWDDLLEVIERLLLDCGKVFGFFGTFLELGENKLHAR